MTIAARMPRRLPKNPNSPRGRLITQQPLEDEPVTDNVYFKQAPRLPRPRTAQGPQAYVPYAPANPAQPYSRPQYVAGDNSMMTLALVGLIITTVVGLPVGLFTGVSALRRAARIEELVRNGRRPMTDRSTISSVRVMSWISIAWSIPLLLVWTAVLGLVVLSLAH